MRIGSLRLMYPLYNEFGSSFRQFFDRLATTVRGRSINRFPVALSNTTAETLRDRTGSSDTFRNHFHRLRDSRIKTVFNIGDYQSKCSCLLQPQGGTRSTRSRIFPGYPFPLRTLNTVDGATPAWLAMSMMVII